MHLPIDVAPEITAVCFKQIDGDYWYGWYLDFAIVMNKQTGWVNATKLCDDHNKLFRNWTRLQQTQDLISTFHKAKIGPITFRASKKVYKEV